MYCPRCATPNAPEARFCRACGTGLAAAASALADHPAPPAPRPEDYGEGRRKAIRGAILLGAALLIGALPALFIGVVFPWVMLWTVFFGWMAGWGVVSLASGVGEAVQSRAVSRRAGPPEVGPAAGRPAVLSAAARGPRTAGEAAGGGPSPPLSVTERTTELLGEARRGVEGAD